MDAKEARAKAHQHNTDEANSQLSKVRDIIKLAVDGGNYDCNIYTSLKPDVKNLLESEGYEVTVFDSQREGTTITISW